MEIEPEREILTETNVQFYKGEFDRLKAELEMARVNSSLPEKPSAKAALDDMLLRLRLGD